MQALKFGKYSLSANQNQTDTFKPVQEKLKEIITTISDEKIIIREKPGIGNLFGVY